MEIQEQRIIQQEPIQVTNIAKTSLLVNISQSTAPWLKRTTGPSTQDNSNPTSVASVMASAEFISNLEAPVKLALGKEQEKKEA